jgi:hypothetical protein
MDLRPGRGDSNSPPLVDPGTQERAGNHFPVRRSPGIKREGRGVFLAEGVDRGRADIVRRIEEAAGIVVGFQQRVDATPQCRERPRRSLTNPCWVLARKPAFAHDFRSSCDFSGSTWDKL